MQKPVRLCFILFTNQYKAYDYCRYRKYYRYPERQLFARQTEKLGNFCGSSIAGSYIYYIF